MNAQIVKPRKFSPKRIKTIRAALGLSQESFAERLGCTFSTVNRWENGHFKPTRFAVFRLENLEHEALRRTAAPGAALKESPEIVLKKEPKSSRSRPERIAVATRNRVILFDPATPEQALAERNFLNAPEDLGPIRSIQFDYLHEKPVLLLGVRNGVILTPLLPGAPAIRFSFSKVSGLGYGTNSACINHGYLYATHSEYGLWRWRVDQPTIAERLFPEILSSKQTVRCVMALDRERMMFISDNELYAFDKAAETPSLIYESPYGARLTAVSLLEHTVYIAASDGRVERYDLVFRRQEPLLSDERTHLYSARIVRCMNTPFLALGTRNPQALLISLDGENERIAYTSGAHNLRLVTATRGHVIAADYDLNNLLIWEADKPDAPSVCIPLAQRLKHHIQDICAIGDTSGNSGIMQNAK
ncbi:MAG: helix-turn-helix domain-containing protein [Candidatus Sumerlaeota bacterium]|nr:helix-turn-helix domain-containing protein [Candidatus Sumerlaeota bacterium]